MTTAQIERAVPFDTGVIDCALTVLVANGVFSVGEGGVVYSRRMVRDAEKASKCSAAGVKGAEVRAGRAPKQPCNVGVDVLDFKAEWFDLVRSVGLGMERLSDYDISMVFRTAKADPSCFPMSEWKKQFELMAINLAGAEPLPRPATTLANWLRPRGTGRTFEDAKQAARDKERKEFMASIKGNK